MLVHLLLLSRLLGLMGPFQPEESSRLSRPATFDATTKHQFSTVFSSSRTSGYSSCNKLGTTQRSCSGRPASSAAKGSSASASAAPIGAGAAGTGRKQRTQLYAPRLLSREGLGNVNGRIPTGRRRGN